MPTTRAAVSREPLSRERVMRAAVVLADAGGLEAVTMRRLARQLSVEPMSLYHHVGGKDDVLGGILELVVAEIEIPAAEGAWKSELRRGAISFFGALQRHPWAAELITSAALVRSGRLRFMEWILGTLDGAGFSRHLVDRAYHALDSHIIGFALWLSSMELDTVDLATAATAFARTLPAGEYPHVLAHIDQHLAPPPAEGGGNFEFGLDLILDGLERLRAQP